MNTFDFSPAPSHALERPAPVFETPTGDRTVEGIKNTTPASASTRPGGAVGKFLGRPERMAVIQFHARQESESPDFPSFDLYRVIAVPGMAAGSVVTMETLRAEGFNPIICIKMPSARFQLPTFNIQLSTLNNEQLI